ncbi:MAG TPA: hypothetical protein VIV56_16835 [Gemmatimonadales bacterium]
MRLIAVEAEPYSEGDARRNPFLKDGVEIVVEIAIGQDTLGVQRWTRVEMFSSDAMSRADLRAIVAPLVIQLLSDHSEVTRLREAVCARAELVHDLAEALDNAAAHAGKPWTPADVKSREALVLKARDIVAESAEFWRA